MSDTPEKLWEPSEEAIERSRLTRYAEWLQRERGVETDSYEQLWGWSVDRLEDFWASIWDYFEVSASEAPARAGPGREAEEPAA